MCTKIGRLYRYSKWSNKLPLTTNTKGRMFSIRPPSLCEHTFQAAGMRLVTSRMMTIIEKGERRKYNTATYENVRDAGRANNVWIIDVRDRKDVETTGCIKNSVNIPLKELEAALQFTPEYFFNRYGVTKPYIDSAIIFSCRTGRLSKVAYELAESMGYKNLKNFDGGYLLYERLCDFN